MNGFGSGTPMDWREREAQLRKKEALRIARASAAAQRQTEKECRPKPRDRAKQYDACGPGSYKAKAHRPEADPEDEVVEFDPYAFAGLCAHLEMTGNLDLYAEEG